MEIPNLLDTSKSLEYQAKQAFEIRNDLRTRARELMADQKAADYLRRNEPNLTWDELVTIKSMKYSGDDLWNSIINSSQKSRESVNAQFNFIGDRPRYD
jgi:filamentous hemagglutinin